MPIHFGEPMPRLKLSDALANNVRLPAVEVKCALSYDRNCCHGAGYCVERKGPWLSAHVCSCVKNCTTCFGAMMKTAEDGSSRQCKKPLPSRIAAILNDATIPARYGEATLKNFRNFTGHGAKVCDVLAKWCEGFKPDHSSSIIISGPVGVGKTYLLACLAREVAEKSYTVRFVDFFQLLAQIKAAYSRKESDEDILKPLIDVDVLFIDELGKGRNTEFELTIIDQLVMGRYNQEKPIVATTNYVLKQFSKAATIDLTTNSNDNGGFSPDVFGPLEMRVGSRIYSRLLEGCLKVELSGQNYRRMKGEN